ncbi:MAG: hypothetical protein IOC90_10195 [Methylocystis sp.]|jgi:hypothetical protein|nr:hypothetical protein [Methylocystis sp.]MCA3583107.1 hypothetical protein [Methylocystis sp.]MCA3588388.1 hypothetical protein [Methylocystis sp.]MCA3593256.1 hypothetical protein [Methylocystis sp.]
MASEEENHWPGYVDALTTMTMMLIFVMTILAVAIFGLSQNVSRSMVEKIAKAINIDNLTDRESTDDLASRVVARLETQQRDTQAATGRASAENPEIWAESAKPVASGHVFTSADRLSPKAAAPAQVLPEPAFITIAFEKRATGIDNATNERIKAAMQASGGLSQPIEIKAFIEKAGSISDARRVAFYRLLNLRGKLIAMGVAPERIRTRIEDASGNESADIVRIDLARTG